MKEIDPQSFFDGNILVTAPHMDDCVLACGGTILQLPRQDRVHVVYCTDGRGIVTRPRVAGQITDKEENIGSIRTAETTRALATLGVPPENVRFLGFPEYEIRASETALRPRLEQLIHRIRPDYIFTPFRYDRHADHVALSHTVRDIARDPGLQARVLEYFVYYQWKLLPAGDVRKYLRAENMLQTDIQSVATAKRTALESFTSQTTVFFPWQHKPVLSEALLTAFSEGPEIFLAADSGATDDALFRISPLTIRLVHALEPALKNTKERTLSVMHRLFRKAAPSL